MSKEKKLKPEVRQIEDILANSADKAKLMTFLDEAVKCKIRIQDENEAIKGLKEEALEKIGLSPKMFSSLAKIALDNSALEKRAEFSALDSALEVLFGATDDKVFSQ